MFSIDGLIKRFQHFASNECKDHSPVYYRLCNEIKNDLEILNKIASFETLQPIPNLLFGSVHLLLLKGNQHNLREYYLSLVAKPKSPEDIYPEFKDFFLNNFEEIEKLMASKLVQTNEVRRCSYLYPAFLLISTFFENKPLHLIEIGASAGLNLFWDKYKYDYGTGDFFGKLDSNIVLKSKFEGSLPKVLELIATPEIASRVALDINCIDVTNPEELLWLEALIWPEQTERRELLKEAVKIRSQHDLLLKDCNGFDEAIRIAVDIDKQAPVCIFHTHVANQIPNEDRILFLKKIDDLGKNRNIVHLFNNIKPTLHLTIYKNGKKIDFPLAKTEGHGYWIDWMND